MIPEVDKGQTRSCSAVCVPPAESKTFGAQWQKARAAERLSTSRFIALLSLNRPSPSERPLEPLDAAPEATYAIGFPIFRNDQARAFPELRSKSCRSIAITSSR